MVVGAGLIAAVFLGGFPGGLLPGLAWFVLKTLVIVSLLAAMRAATSRIRIDQMIHFSWRWLAPLAVLQLFIVIVIKGLVS
jgi:NADH-quinone oxidoreductase subunit H